MWEGRKRGRSVNIFAPVNLPDLEDWLYHTVLLGGNARFNVDLIRETLSLSVFARWPEQIVQIIVIELKILYIHKSIVTPESTQEIY